MKNPRQRRIEFWDRDELGQPIDIEWGWLLGIYQETTVEYIAREPYLFHEIKAVIETETGEVKRIDPENMKFFKQNT